MSKHIKRFDESSSQLESNVELELVKFFESFGKKYEIDRQWIVDRFNEKETKDFVNYVYNILVKSTR